MSELLRYILSVLAILVPLAIVGWWAGERIYDAPLKYYGIGFIAVGVTTWLGVKYLGLISVGRFGKPVVGKPALQVSWFMAGTGVLLIAIHYFMHRHDAKKGLTRR